MRTRRVGLGAGALGAVLVLVPAFAAPSVAGQFGPGCTGRSAVAHYAGGVPVIPVPRNGAVPCGVSTGFAGAESHIVATAKSVIFTPAVQPSGLVGTGTAPVPIDSTTQSNADPAGLAVTSDHGASWTLVKPAGVTWNPTDHGDFVDSRTDRLFFEDYGPIPLAPSLGAAQEGPAHIMWTDTPTSSAGWHHVAVASMFLPENPRFTTSAPPAGGAAPAGYPDVVYFCANTNVGFVSPVIAGRVCFKSLDGGSSFAPTGVLFTGTVPQHPECGPSGEIYSAIDGYYPQPAPDGSLYVMVACGGSTYLARSTDEAATFPVIHGATGAPVKIPVPPSSPGQVGSPDLRIDASGTMYVMWSTASKLLAIVSGDNGRSWTAPLDVTAPGVTVGQWAMAEGAGTLAVAYLGHTAGQATQDAYITGSRDLSAVLRGGRPILYSARVNERPILYGSGIQGSGYVTLPLGQRAPFPPPFGNQMFGNDFIGATIAPDGSAWGSFDQDCGPTADSPGCVAQADQTRGFAGRLVWVAGQGATPEPAPGPLAPRPLPAPAVAALPATGGRPLALAGLLLGIAALLAGFGRRRVT